MMSLPVWSHVPSSGSLLPGGAGGPSSQVATAAVSMDPTGIQSCSKCHYKCNIKFSFQNVTLSIISTLNCS